MPPLEDVRGGVPQGRRGFEMCALPANNPPVKTCGFASPLYTRGPYARRKSVQKFAKVKLLKMVKTCENTRKQAKTKENRHKTFCKGQNLTLTIFDLLGILRENDENAAKTAAENERGNKYAHK